MSALIANDDNFGSSWLRVFGIIIKQCSVYGKPNEFIGIFHGSDLLTEFEVFE